VATLTTKITAPDAVRWTLS